MEDDQDVPLVAEEIARYNRTGYLSPIRLISPDEAAQLKTAVAEHILGHRKSERYELTDRFVVERAINEKGESVLEYTEGGESEDLHTFPFLFNLWRGDERFKRVAMNPVIAGIARQLLDTDQVLLMEDNVVVKNPRSKTIPWHQDFSYWPLEKPAAVTLWIALDVIDAANGGMQVAPGTHLAGERLPVWFRDAEPFLSEERRLPPVPQDPSAEGHEVVSYSLRPGEGGFHHPMVWHGSPPNTTDQPRVAFVLRYVAIGSTWLGDTRMPYDDIGCRVGDPLTADHFPLVKTAF